MKRETTKKKTEKYRKTRKCEWRRKISREKFEEKNTKKWPGNVK